jgi:plastocyanin
MKLLIALPLAGVVAFASLNFASVRSQPSVIPAAGPISEIEIKSFRFLKDTVRVTPGTVVRWINRDAVGHTSTADDGDWESRLLGPGESFEHRLDRAGTFTYHCTPHPFMRGVVIVEEVP